MPFYLTKYTFNNVPISMFLVSKSEPRLTKYGLEVFCSIDEKHSIIDLMFLSEFPQEPFCQHGRSGRIQSYMEYVVCF